MNQALDEVKAQVEIMLIMDYVESLRFLLSNQESGGDSVLTWHYRTKSFLIHIIDIPVLRPSTRRTS